MSLLLFLLPCNALLLQPSPRCVLRAQPTPLRATCAPLLRADDGCRPLPLHAIVEVWHAKRLCVGNYRGRAPAPSRALLVDLSGGERIRADAGQLVDVWAEHPDAGAPNASSAWAAPA